MYDRKVGGGTFGSLPIGIPFGANWRPAHAVYRFATLDRRNGGDYLFGPIYQTGMFLDPSTPVKFSIHVNTNQGKVIDLGGIIDMGTINGGSCKVFENGKVQ